MNWLRNFLYGRHGSDALSFALMILFIILSILFISNSLELYHQSFEQARKSPELQRFRTFCLLSDLTLR